VYAYEHGNTSRVGDKTQDQLIHDIDEDEFYPQPLENRIVLNEIEAYFTKNSPATGDDLLVELKKHLHHSCFNVEEVIHDLLDFCRITPRLPAPDKQRGAVPPIELNPDMSREEMIEHLEDLRKVNETADLAFTAYRDMSRSPWKPFIKAALERNPVSPIESDGMAIPEIYEKIASFENESIYDSTRMAQPDEVWNFARGDGMEKALCLMNCMVHHDKGDPPALKGDGKSIVVVQGKKEYSFTSRKNLAMPHEDDFTFPG